jgi:regulator of replication initiation timing
MTDILEKLDERINRADHGVDRQMAREAKAEIEKLRAENERLREELDVLKSVFPDEDNLPGLSAGDGGDFRSTGNAANYEKKCAMLSAHNKRLQKSVDVLREVRDGLLKGILAKIDEVKKLTAENERLREALEPFATFCAEMDALPHCAAKPDEAVIHWPLTVGAFRAARSALEEK